MRPSFGGLAASGSLLVAALILLIYYISKGETNGWNSYQIISLMVFISSAIAAHSTLHHYEELYYDFNPINGKYIPKDEAHGIPIYND